ncbi:hypothetical protein CO046_04600 [Candidatus Peregrinibacteria bacterium CG_4_9_14_0_2_um_filter_53_11]|nr:MAG: hypothetical protein CO046_04600 [Candidatus Peregrinibacteria bacterium CG_4_9_14_0_2_um_filter_53_11]
MLTNHTSHYTGRRLIYRQPRNGELISHIAAAKKKIQHEIETTAAAYEAKIRSAQESRTRLIDGLRSKNGGIKIRTEHDPNTVDHIVEAGTASVDDAGKLIETNFQIEVSSEQEVVDAINYCKENRLLAMPIGAKTSALGVFEAMHAAAVNGLNGVVGIVIKDITGDQDGSAIALSIPEYNTEEYELVRHPNLPIALLKSTDFRARPHRIIAYAGAHIEDANIFLNKEIKDKKYRFRLMPDPTSKAEAQIGGVVATGAEGGNRTKASEDVLRARMINGNGELIDAGPEELSKLVGLNGNAGIITEAEFEVSAFPKNEHALFIPVNGSGKDAWKNMLRIQQLLKKFCRPDGENSRLQERNEYDGLIITGIEPLSRNAIDIATEASTKPFDKKLNKVMGSHDFGLYITCSSFEKDLNLEFLEEILGMDIEEGEADGDDFFLSKKADEKSFSRFAVFQHQEHKRMDEIRHGAPSHSREKARKLGGVTSSTDLNIRIETDDETEQELAQEALGAIFSEFTDSFDDRNGFRVAVYGHMHPGVGMGGGINPHIRVLFELSNPSSRRHAPEQVLAMKDQQKKLYRKLLALDGKYGIKILCPEKSRFTNAEYWNWLCLYKPEEAEKYLQAVVEGGYARDDQGRPTIPTLGARIPHEMPGSLPRQPGAVGEILDRGYIFDDEELIPDVPNMPPVVQKYLHSILELSQLSHRGAEVKRLFAEVDRTIHEKFRLSNRQYAFHIESAREGEAIVQRNLGDSHDYNIEYVSLSSLDALKAETPLFPDDGKTFYVVNFEGIGVLPGLSLLITPHQAVKDSYENKNNKAAFRNLHDMWARWPAETSETPNIPAVASLGLILQQDEIAPRNEAKTTGRQTYLPVVLSKYEKEISKAATEKGFRYDKETVMLPTDTEGEPDMQTLQARLAEAASHTERDLVKTWTFRFQNPEGKIVREVEYLTASERFYVEAWVDPKLREELEDVVYLWRDGQENRQILTANPGPGQLHESIRSPQKLLKLLELLKQHNGNGLSPELQKEIIEKFRHFVGIPSSHKLGFLGSATQCMQQLAEAISRNESAFEVIQVTNGSFSERLNEVLTKHLKKVNRITTPWTTSEHSELKPVVARIKDAIAKAGSKRPVIFVTPHKTSTSADFLPDHLLKALKEEGLIQGRDFDMICDVTSGIGARHYATLDDPDTGEGRIPFGGWFGSFQKGMGLPPGIAFLSLSPQLAQRLGYGSTVEESTPDFNLSASLDAASNGSVNNPLALALLREKLSAEQEQKRTPETIQAEAREKINMVMGWMDTHADLMPLVQNAVDRSPLLMGIFSQSKNLVVARRLLSEIFGYHIGAGYGPYSSEAIRLYLPNLTLRDTERLLTALDHVLTLDDVVKTRGENIPNIALREPHDPLAVIDRLSRDLSADDIFKDEAGLGWLDRIVKTYNAGVEPPRRRKMRGRLPATTNAYDEKAGIYNFDRNIRAMEAILNLSDTNGHTILMHYTLLQDNLSNIRDMIAGAPEEIYNESDDFTAMVNFYLTQARESLTTISQLLKQYTETAERDADGFVIWPLAA